MPEVQDFLRAAWQQAETERVNSERAREHREQQARVEREAAEKRAAIEVEKATQRDRLASKAEKRGKTSLWCGLIGLFCLSPILVCSVLAIIFGIRSLNGFSYRKDSRGKWRAITGITLGSLSILSGAFYWTYAVIGEMRHVAVIPATEKHWTLGIQKYDKNTGVPFNWDPYSFYSAK